MRAPNRHGAVKALAVAGTRVVVLGWDMSAADINYDHAAISVPCGVG